MRRPISYYDKVKDDVNSSNDTSKPNFDTLREAAQENTESEDEREGDDTEIEVLDEGLRGRGGGPEKQSSQAAAAAQKQRQESQQPGQSTAGGRSEMETNSSSGNSNPMRSAASSDTQGSGTVETDELAEKMDTLIQQNERIIEILESFGS